MIRALVAMCALFSMVFGALPIQPAAAGQCQLNIIWNNTTPPSFTPSCIGDCTNPTCVVIITLGVVSCPCYDTTPCAARFDSTTWYWDCKNKTLCDPVPPDCFRLNSPVPPGVATRICSCTFF